MLSRQYFALSGCVLCATLLISCSSDKVLPSGKRLAVLEQDEVMRVETSDAASYIRVPAAETIKSWLQSDLDATHAGKNVRVGTDFNEQWVAGFGTGSSRREFLLSKPLVKDGIVYTLDADAVLTAFNLKDGEKVWSLELESENNRVNATALKGAGIAIAGDQIFVTTGFGVVAAVNLKTQKKVWEQNVKAPIRIAPVVANKRVFVQSADNNFFALDANSGEILWKHDIALESTTMVGGSQAAYIPNADIVVMGFSNGELQAFNASLGVPLWSDVLVANHRAYSSTFLHTLKAAPVIDGEHVYALGSSGILTMIDSRTGERIWVKEMGGTATPLLVDNTLYVATDNRYLVALKKDSGDILWSTKIEAEKLDKNASLYMPIMMNGHIIVTSSDGHIFSFNPVNGKLDKTLNMNTDLSAAPVVADGYVLLTTTKAKLLVFK